MFQFAAPKVLTFVTCAWLFTQVHQILSQGLYPIQLKTGLALHSLNSDSRLIVYVEEMNDIDRVLVEINLIFFSQDEFCVLLNFFHNKEFH